MREVYPFLVEKLKKEGNFSIIEQYLFCTCGNKQKTKIGERRVLLRNNENVYDDKLEFDEIICENCKKKYDAFQNIHTIKNNQSILVEIAFEPEKSKSKGSSIKKLKRSCKYFYYLEEENEIDFFVISDIISVNEKTNKISVVYNLGENKGVGFHSSFFAPNIFKTLDKTPESPDFNIKMQKIKESFDLCYGKLLDSFFQYESSINYKGLENAFDFIDDIFSKNYDYEYVCQESFLKNFKISKKIHKEDNFGEQAFYVYKKNIFGGEKHIKRKLDVGDYLYQLKKLAEICFMFTSFPPIASLFKYKGLDFIHKTYKESYFPSQKLLLNKNATNPFKILEYCCDHYFNYRINIEITFKNKPEEINFRISPIILKAVSTFDELMMIYKFSRKEILSKSEIEHLFQKFDHKSVLTVIDGFVTKPNIRGAKITLKHICHIIKNNLFSESSNWLEIYYDTLTNLKLIVEIIEEKKKEDGSKSSIGKLKKISEDRIFDIKNYDKLKELHDETTSIYRTLEDESKNEKYCSAVNKYINLNKEINMFDFKVIPNLNDLSKEGMIMHHCVYTYLNEIVEGTYLTIIVKDMISKERATMGLKIVGEKLYLQQLKGYYNSRPTALLIKTSLDFCKKQKITIESKYLYPEDITPNQSLEKRMKNYLSIEEATEIRLKNKKNIE